jgi:hypothetical protein
MFPIVPIGACMKKNIIGGQLRNPRDVGRPDETFPLNTQRSSKWIDLATRIFDYLVHRSTIRRSTTSKPAKNRNESAPSKLKAIIVEEEAA